MSDFDRKLGDALKSVGDAYRPADVSGAQQEFLYRRHRRRSFQVAGGVALAGAAVALAIVVAQNNPFEEESIAPASRLEITATIDVGEEPDGIAVGDGTVFVANSGDDSVTRIDGATNEASELPGTFTDVHDVAVDDGTLWAVSTEGAVSLQATDGSGPAGSGYTVHGVDGRHMDLAAGGGYGYAVVRDAFVQVMGSDLNTPKPDGPNPSDAAADEESVWVLGEDSRAVRRYSHGLKGSGERFELPYASANSDLAVGDGYVWVAYGDRGTVVRLDPATDTVSEEIQLGGKYVGIAVGEGAVWAVSYDDSDFGTVYRIDPTTLEITGAVSLIGGPVDVAAGDGGVWVSQKNAGTVTRIEIVEGEPEPAPEAEDLRGNLLFVYSADGDIYGEAANGSVIQLTDTADEDKHPTFAPDGSAIVFDRTSDPSLPPELVAFDLHDQSEEVLGEGAWPSYGPDGRLAWVTGAPTDTRIAIGSPGAEPEIEFPAETCVGDGGQCPTNVFNIAWDEAGEYIYYEAGWEGYNGLYQAGVSGKEVTPFDLGEAVGYDFGDEGTALYAAPSVRDPNSVHVIKVCCSRNPDDPYDSVELGLIQFTEGGPEYTALQELGSDSHSELSLAAGGTLTARGSDGGIEWGNDNDRAWLVSSFESLWLIKGSENNVELTDMTSHSGETEYAGVAVNPDVAGDEPQLGSTDGESP